MLAKYLVGKLTSNISVQTWLEYFYSQTDVVMIPDSDRSFMNYSVTGIDIWLTRNKTPFLLQFYFPSTMFVFTSWVGFIIPYNSGERTGLIVTLQLVVVSMYLAVVASSPKGKTFSSFFCCSQQWPWRVKIAQTDPVLNLSLLCFPSKFYLAKQSTLLSQA